MASLPANIGAHVGGALVSRACFDLGLIAGYACASAFATGPFRMVAPVIRSPKTVSNAAIEKVCINFLLG
jgi:hypothetical protein